MKYTANQIIFLTTVAFLCSCGNLNREIWFKKNGEATMKLELLSEDYVSLYEKCKKHKEVKSTFIDYEIKKPISSTSASDGSDLIISEEEVADVPFSEAEPGTKTAIIEEEPADEITKEVAPTHYDTSPMTKFRDLVKDIDENLDTIINFGKRLKESKITQLDNSQPLNKWNVHFMNQKKQSYKKAMSVGMMSLYNSTIVQVSFDYKNKDEFKMYYNEVDNVIKQIKYSPLMPFENINYDHDVVAKKIEGSSLVLERHQSFIEQVKSMSDQELEANIKAFSPLINNTILHLPGKLKNITGVKYKMIDESTIMITTDMKALCRNGFLPAFTISYY